MWRKTYISDKLSYWRRQHDLHSAREVMCIIIQRLNTNGLQYGWVQRIPCIYDERCPERGIEWRWRQSLVAKKVNVPKFHGRWGWWKANGWTHWY